MAKLELNGFTLVVPADWSDITSELPPDSPVTLGSGADVGALQFSIARYAGGLPPDVDSAALLEMLIGIARSNALGDPDDIIRESAPLHLAAASFRNAEHFTRLWTLSDGRNCLLATYTCDVGSEDIDLADCEAIVRTVSWTAPTEG